MPRVNDIALIYSFSRSFLVLPKCYSDTSCSNQLYSENGINVETAEDCCVGTDSGMAWKLKDEPCNTCKGIFKCFIHATFLI